MMEKTNKIEKININCATKIEQLEQMYDLVSFVGCLNTRQIGITERWYLLIGFTHQVRHVIIVATSIKASH